MPNIASSPSKKAHVSAKAIMQEKISKEGKLGDALARLNEDQRRAVETNEGPVMVIAGPGTGKTEVLGLRVAQILKKTQVNPSSVLCLTFSTSGATAMRDRLRSHIGAAAYKVAVHTIHGFCNDIIASHPHVFEEWAAKEQISDVERYRMLNTIIDQLLPHMKLVNRKYPYERTAHLLSAISTLKREGKADPDGLNDTKKQYALLKSKESKPGTKQHEKNLLAAEKFGEVVQVFLKYQKALEESGRYDFDDMILTVIRALTQEDWLLAELQVRYQYILVDEFQDTNGSQFKVLELLTKPRTPEDNPNFFVVGDDDQAIYRFQGANLGNILSFHKRFPDAPIIVLKTSYSCSQSILAAAGSVIAKNTERLVGTIEGLTKDLIAGSCEQGSPPALLIAPSDATEPWLIADLIEERIASGTEAKEIAVFTQTNREVRPLYDVLEARGIPVQMSGKVDLLTHPLVSQILAILRAVHHIDDNGMLAAALACDCFGCHPADLGRIFDLRRDLSLSLQKLLLSFGEPMGSDPIPLHDRESIIHARDILLGLKQKLPSRTIVETLENVIRQCGFIPQKASDIDPLDFAAVQEFFERVKMRAYEQPHYSFEVWMSDLEFYGHPEYSDLRLTYELPHLTEEGVHVMTAHRSKGLEFDVAILSQFREKHWDHRRPQHGVSMPEDLLFGWKKEQKSFEREQDERRVAYVAMTRARHELMFTCPKQVTQGERSVDVSPSQFFAEAGDLPEEERGIKDPEAASTLLLTPPREIDAELRAFLLHRLKNFSLSATALEHFLDDPQKFLELDLLQMPETKKSVFVYGNAVHEALRHWAFEYQKGNRLEKDAFFTAFSDYMKSKEILTDAERERLLKTGEEALPRYFDVRLKDASSHIQFIEHPITVRWDDIPLKGKIDRIDLLSPVSSEAHVIDYKTGRPHTENEIREGAKFRQLTFYALLLEPGLPMLQPHSFTLDFIGEREEHPILRTFTITENEKKDLQKII